MKYMEICETPEAASLQACLSEQDSPFTSSFSPLKISAYHEGSADFFSSASVCCAPFLIALIHMFISTFPAAALQLSLARLILIICLLHRLHLSSILCLAAAIWLCVIAESSTSCYSIQRCGLIALSRLEASKPER